MKKTSKKKEGLAEKLAALKAQQAIAEEARVKLETMAQEARKEAETIIPQIQAEVNEIDKKIAELQQSRGGLLEQLKLLGLKTKGKGAGGARGGGYADSLKELMRGVGIGGTLTNADIKEHLGSESGYVGMLIKAQLEAGNLRRTEAGKYEVVGSP